MFNNVVGEQPNGAVQKRVRRGLLPVSQSGSHRGPAMRATRGFTLVEALLAMVVLGIGLAGLLVAFNTIGKRSADPLVHKQMSAIAQELLEEISLKPYAVAANAAPTGCARDTFNDVADYHGYSRTGICTIDGTAVAALASYSVSISVTSSALAGVAAARRISITVSHSGKSLTLVGWRTDYAS